MSKKVETPLMKQYGQIKLQHPGAILLFRVGDFYETFGEDAVKTAGILGITLTKRANGSASEVELAGFPHHALDTYLPKLVKAGQRVAICDQLEDPKLTKTIVKRGVTELVTPGVTMSDKVLDHKSNNYLVALHIVDQEHIGAAFTDISTGEFLVAEGNKDSIEKLLQSFRPAEVLFQKGLLKEFNILFGTSYYCNMVDSWVCQADFCQELLLQHFATASLKGFGIDKMPHANIAAGIILHYLAETKHPDIKHINAISRIDAASFVWMDRFTIKNLELIDSHAEDGKSLLQVLDHTLTPMGARLLKKWMVFPLKQINLINDRVDIVSYLIDNKEFTAEIRQNTRQVGDLERLISKVATSRVNPREAVQLKKALQIVPKLRQLCNQSNLEQLLRFADQLNPCEIITAKLEKMLHPEPPLTINKGNVICDGVDERLDEYRVLLKTGKSYLDQMLAREIARTGITSLKISFNNVFGHYIEVTNTHKDKVPDDWIRKQTLVNAERYITQELKTYEEKILGAEDKIQQLETELFNELVFSLLEYIQPIQQNAGLIARLDCLQGFANAADKNNYSKPILDESNTITIVEGRHPVIELNLPPGEKYITNDILLDDQNQQIIMITGPNMAGKSALLRQTALIVLMAQMGSYVPASHSQIGVIDKLFTRVGATDNISSGESTFMVEMNETASILNNLTNKSLILLDEIGRGTSTYDGISIAWAIAEYIHELKDMKAKTLFATHYHELNEMENSFDRIHNYNVSVKEINGKIIFLRKLRKGGSEHSFGIHVAQLAGIPRPVVLKASQILKKLEEGRAQQNADVKHKGAQKLTSANPTMQLSLFQMEIPQELQDIRNALELIDINTLTPVEALFKINELKQILDKN